MDDFESSSGIGRFVRTELLGTVAVVLMLVVGYGYLFLEDHLEWGAEYVLGRSLGAEVNIGDLRTGWVRPELTMKDLRVTNPDDPDRNVLELGTLTVEMDLDALLRMKYVVNDASLEELRTGTERSTPGWVSEDGGDLRWVYRMLLDTVKSRVEESASGTVLGDVGSLLGGESLDDLIRKHSDSLRVREQLTGARSTIETTESDLRTTLGRLPSREDYGRLEKRVKSIDESSKKTSEKIATLRTLRRTLKEWKSTLESARDHVQGSLADLESSVEGVESALNEDVGTLRRRVELPSLTFENPSTELFQAFVAERGGSIQDLLLYYDQYVASNSADRSASEPAAATSDNIPGESPGRDYSFQTHWSYPDFWLKEFRLSGAGNEPNSLRFFARVRNVSTYSPVVSGQSGVVFNVTNPTETLGRLEGNLSKTHRNGQSVLRYRLTMKNLALEPWELISGESVGLRLNGGNLLVDFSGNLRENTLTSLVSFRMEDPVFDISGSSDLLKQVVRESVSELEYLQLKGTGKGPPGAMNWRIQSNLGTALEEGVRTVVSARSGEIKARVVEEYRRRIEDEQRQLTESVEELTAEFERRLDERSDRLNSLEKKVRNRLEKAAEKKGVESLRKSFN